MSKDIFISYSTKDTDITDKIHDYLEDKGFSCWMAPREIKPGDDYSQKIIDALNSTKIVLLVFSKSSHASEYVTEEIDNAFSRDVPILPFKIDETLPEGKMEFYLRHSQWLDASSNPEDYFPELLKHADRLCKGKRIETPKPKPADQVRVIEPPKRPILSYILVAVIAIIAVVGGFMLFSGTGDSSGDVNETGISVDFIELDDDTGKGYSWKYSYFVYGTVSSDLSNSTDNTLHTDFLDKSGKVVTSNETKVDDINDNTLASVYLDDNNVDKVSVELRDGDGKVLYSARSNNIKSVGG